MVTARPHLLIVTGPPGSGKTTIARRLARTRRRSVHIESDHFFHFISSGYIEPWLPGSLDQNKMVMSIVADAAATYARHGYFTIIDGIVAPGAAFEPVRDRLHDAGMHVAYAILLPDLGVTIQRARARGQTQLADPAVLEHLDAGFRRAVLFHIHMVDNGNQTAEQTAEQISALLAAGQLDLQQE
jgi:predicted kinase